MLLNDYYNKVKNIKSTNPPPKGLNGFDINRHYRKIISEWQAQLSKKDRKTVVYYGKEDYFDDGKGHVLLQNQPLSVCDKTASALGELAQNDLFISGSTFHYDGGGCC